MKKIVTFEKLYRHIIIFCNEENFIHPAFGTNCYIYNKLQQQ